MGVAACHPQRCPGVARGHPRHLTVLEDSHAVCVLGEVLALLKETNRIQRVTMRKKTTWIQEAHLGFFSNLGLEFRWRWGRRRTGYKGCWDSNNTGYGRGWSRGTPYHLWGWRADIPSPPLAGVGQPPLCYFFFNFFFKKISFIILYF